MVVVNVRKGKNMLYKRDLAKLGRGGQKGGSSVEVTFMLKT